MTDSFDNVPEPDDRPARVPAPAQRPVVLRERRRSGTGRLLRWWLASSFLLVIACIACLAVVLNQLDFTPLHIVIDGDDVSNGLTINGVTAGVKVLIAAGVVMLALLLLLLVPMVVLLVVGAVAIALVAGLGTPIIALAVALLVVSSPLWAVALVVWLVARRRRPSPRARRSATIAA